MADNEKEGEEYDDSLWKDLIEKVKKENRAASTKSIEGPAPFKESVIPKSIEKPTIDDVSIENPVTEPAPIESVKTPAKRIAKGSGKFTTIMITKDLKKRLTGKKQPRESYGDLLERLLENK